MNRTEFAVAHPEVFLLDPAADSDAIARHLRELGALSPGDQPVRVSRAGDGNMNCTVRVVAPGRRLIVKQGRPWVEKFDHIAAPWDRTLVEAAFYEVIAHDATVATDMPQLLAVDRASRILVLEDVDGPSWTSLYAGDVIDWGTLEILIGYLIRIHALQLDSSSRALFQNRDMRALNHEHIFSFPLRASNGLDLDRITPGLEAAADRVKRNTEFLARVAELGNRYLAGGPQLVHGDFFPGSWLRSRRGPVIIDPEFCFVGRGEFDFGVMIAHLILGRQTSEIIDRVRTSIPGTYDTVLIERFAGVEIMRRLIGVAQLPLEASLMQKEAWLEEARELVMAC